MIREHTGSCQHDLIECVEIRTNTLAQTKEQESERRRKSKTVSFFSTFNVLSPSLFLFFWSPGSHFSLWQPS